MNRIAPLILFALLAVALGFSLTQPPRSVPQKTFALPQLTLAPIATPEQPVLFTPQPGKVTLLNFFASWCVPCLAEHPELKKLAADRNLIIEGVAWNDTADNMHAWLKKHGNPYHRVWMDPQGDAAITLGLRGVPESFLIDGDGRVRLHIQGALTPDARAQLQSLVQRMEANHAH